MWLVLTLVTLFSRLAVSSTGTCHGSRRSDSEALQVSAVTTAAPKSQKKMSHMQSNFSYPYLHKYFDLIHKNYIRIVETYFYSSTVLFSFINISQ